MPAGSVSNSSTLQILRDIVKVTEIVEKWKEIDIYIYICVCVCVCVCELRSVGISQADQAGLDKALKGEKIE